MTAKERLLNVGLLWLRVLVGLGIASHGYQKIFGGQLSLLINSVTEMGFPQPVLLGWAAALSEFAGGILIVLGLGTRVAACFVFATMSVAAFIAHASDPFQVKELALAYWTMAGFLILSGGGIFSLDAKCFREG